MWFILCLALFSLVNADREIPEYVTKKFCKNVDPNQCTIHTVVVDPCTQGPAFCNMKRNKKYVLTVNMSPKFSAQKIKLSIYGDVQNDSTFSAVIQDPKAACGYLTCPVHAEQRRIFDIDLTLDKRATAGKFPVQVKLWNEDNESQACCFTFNVKVK